MRLMTYVARKQTIEIRTKKSFKVKSRRIVSEGIAAAEMQSLSMIDFSI